MQIDYEIQLEISKRNFIEIETRQYDDMSRVIKALIVNNGEPVTIPTGTTVNCEVKKPDGTYVKAVCSTITESGKTYIVIVLTQNMLAAHGQELIDIVLVHNNQTIGTMSFINRIRKAAVQDDDVMSTSEARELVEAMEEAEALKSDIEDAGGRLDTLEANLEAEAEARAAAVTAEAQARAEADTALGNDVDDLKSAIYNKYTNIEFSVIGERINMSGGFSGQSNMSRSALYPCVEGLIVETHGKSFIGQGSPQLCLIAFYDGGKNLISGIGRFNSETASAEGTISATAPQGTKYVAFSTNSDNPAGVGYYARVYDVDYFVHTYTNKSIEKLNAKLNTAIFNGKSVFDSSIFVNGGMSQGELIPAYTFRVATYPSFLKFDYPLTIVANTGYKFGLHLFDEEGQFVLDPGWQTEYIVPQNTTFRIIIAKVQEDQSKSAYIEEFVSNIIINTKADAEIAALSFAPSYYYSGEPIDFKKHGFKMSSLFAVPSVPTGATYQQGFAIYGGVLFQLYSNNKVKLVNYTNGQTIATLDINSDHGDTIDFSTEFYDVSDEFPLVYITADTNPAKVYVVRITRTATTLIRTYYFGDLSKTGYYAGHSLDESNNVIYMVGYTENSFYLDENGTNKMIVSKWDLNDCTTNQDGTLTPTLLDSFTVKFMRTLQGQRFFDNKLFLLSSHNGAGSLPVNTTIYVVDPFKKIITSVFDSFPTSIKDNECEGIEFVLNGDVYDMIISNTSYYRLVLS